MKRRDAQHVQPPEQRQNQGREHQPDANYQAAKARGLIDGTERRWSPGTIRQPITFLLREELGGNNRPIGAQVKIIGFVFQSRDSATGRARRQFNRGHFIHKKPSFDKNGFLPDIGDMDIPKNEVLRDALSRDLRPAGSKDLVKVIDDAVRKVFTVNKDGAVLVFGHKQPDAAYWNGVKHYGSGPSSRIRVRRTATVSTEKPKAAASVAKKRTKSVAKDVSVAAAE